MPLVVLYQVCSASRAVSARAVGVIAATEGARIGKTNPARILCVCVCVSSWICRGELRLLSILLEMQMMCHCAKRGRNAPRIHARDGDILFWKDMCHDAL